MKPATTIITSTYNKYNYFVDAAQTVLAQTRSDWQWWVILNSPVEKLEIVVQGYASIDPRITVFYHPCTEEERRKFYQPAIIINKYYPRVDTPYLVWLSDDDLWEATFLEDLVGELEADPSKDIVYGSCDLVYWPLVNAKEWIYRTTLKADKKIGAGTKLDPPLFVDGGQVVQTKRSYDALKGWQLPTDWKSGSHLDGIYTSMLGNQFVFHPVNKKVCTKRYSAWATFGHPKILLRVT